MRQVPKYVVSVLLLLVLLTDLSYSLMQHFQGTLDGDMAYIIWPSPPWRQVLSDPFAWHALVDKAVYAGTNRFMAHWSLERFYKTVPFFLQKFVSPLDSIYLTGAIAKTMIQAALIYLMSVYASGAVKLLDRKLLLAAILITPFFQTFGANNEIGIIDASITYSFFYGLATVWLLLFFLPFFLHFFHGWQFPSKAGTALLMIPVGWIVSFNGPLNAPVLLLLCPAILLYSGWRVLKDRKERSIVMKSSISGMPAFLIVGLVAGIIFAALSFYAGKFNVENLSQTMSLGDRYALLPKGILLFFTARPMLLLVAVLAVNMILINSVKSPARNKINRLFFGFLAFAVLYISLLPLGGYREYRPYIIRKDSVQVILVGVFIVYAISSLQLIRDFSGWKRILYSGALIFIALRFTMADRLNPENNRCEREALQAISVAPESIVLVNRQCNIMAWQKITNYAESRYNAALLHYWHVFPEVKYYYQK